MTHVIASSIRAAHAAEHALFSFFDTYEQRRDGVGVCDFALGNPHEMPMPEYPATLKRWTGHIVDMPGHFRVSLTANEDMVERALPIFNAVREGAWLST